MENTLTPVPRPRRRRWPRVLAWFAVVVGLLLVASYFVLTSTAFFKSVVLPRVSRELNAQITVRDADLSPFSAVTLHGVTVRTTGEEPLLRAETVVVRYDLKSMLAGNVVVHEIRLESPDIYLVEQPNGSSNLDPLLKDEKEATSTPDDDSSSSPTQLHIARLTIKDGRLRSTKIYDTQHRDVTEVSNLTVDLDNLRNGHEGTVAFSALVTTTSAPPPPGTNGNLRAEATGDFKFMLTPDMQPATVQGAALLAVKAAGGSLSQANGLEAALRAEVTPTEIKSLALEFSKATTNLGHVTITGPFDAAKTEGHLTLVAHGIDRRLLNILGAETGLDFGAASITATNDMELLAGGSVVRTRLTLDVLRLSLSQQGKTSPVLDLRLQLASSIDTSNQVAELQAMTLQGSQNAQPFIYGSLTSPMKISWAQGAKPLGDSALQLSITNLHLADWAALLQSNTVDAVVAADMSLQARASSDELTFEAVSRITNISTGGSSNTLAGTEAFARLNARVTGGDQIHLRDTRLELVRNTARLVSLSVTGDYSMATSNANIAFNLDAGLPGLAALSGMPELRAENGRVQMHGRALQTNGAQSIVGSFELAGFAGQYDTYHFTNFGAQANLDIQANADRANIRTITGSLNNGGEPGGAFQASGVYEFATATFDGTFTLTNFNEAGLAPFLQPSLGENALVSVSMQGAARTRYDPQGSATVVADLQVTNLVIREAQKTAPNAPLALRAELDVAQEKDVAEFRQARLTLSPTDRAKNEVSLSGRLDLSDTNVTQGTLKIVSPGLDLTPYYDMFAGPVDTNTAAASESTPPETSSAKSPPPTEPKATTLPFRKFFLEVAIDALYLREVAISNWQSTVKLDGGRVDLQPFQFNMNGAPVEGSLNLNLGVDGYEYALTLSAGRLALEPLVNTFTPEDKGRYKGDLLAQAQFKGRGTTGVNLREHLTGNVSLNFTNADLQIVQPQFKKLLAPIAAALRAPELMNSPLNHFAVQATASQGKIDVTQLIAASTAFRAETRGAIPIADILERSTLNDWPVAFSLSRALANAARLTPTNASPEAQFILLPSFIRLAGTLEEPAVKIDKLGLAGSVLERFGDKIPGLDEKTGNLLKGLGEALAPKPAPSNGTNTAPTVSTNQPAKPAFNPRDLFRKKK